MDEASPPAFGSGILQGAVMSNFAAAGVGLIARALARQGLLSGEDLNHLRAILAGARDAIPQPGPELQHLFDALEQMLRDP